MLRHSTPATFLWLLTIALLAVRMGDAHLHLCLDGQSRPVSLHVADAPTHHGEKDSADGHTDQDLDVSAATLFKKAADLDDLPLAALAAFVLALLLPVVKGVAPRSNLLTLALAPAFHLRPPLRGPPR